MRISESCAKCLYDRQKTRCKDAEYLEQVRKLIQERGENDTSPLLVYRFQMEYEKRFGRRDGYALLKRRYNDMMLGLMEVFREKINAADDPLQRALAFSRTGNYIDYGAMDTVDETVLFSLFHESALREEEQDVYRRFLDSCAKADTFLLAADNCGEIVLDRLFLEQLHARFPHLRLQVLVRGGEVLNDVTMDDARYTGIDRIAEVFAGSAPVAGTIYELLPESSRKALDGADMILSKGQGNYESLSGQDRHVFYAFLCKCELFTNRFKVPLLTGMFIEEEIRE